MLESFLDYLRFEKRFSDHTVKAYQIDLSEFVIFSEAKSINDFSVFKSSFIRSWIVELIEKGLKPKSVNRKLAALRSFYKWLRKEGIVESNPMSKVKGPKNEKRLPSFAKESELHPSKLELVFDDDEKGQMDRLMFEVFYQTGIRLSELLNLKKTDISNGKLKVLGKRNKERIIPISDDLNDLLNKFYLIQSKKRKQSEYVFNLTNGQKLYPTFVYRRINYYLSLATSLDKKSPHILRHSFATHMLNRGAGIETLKDLLGHANLSATQIYTHNSFAQLNNIYKQSHPRG
tara:strand:- start:173 stop:1039 length:867 start_codon:yes stop_codon:yes gene_type:complete